MFFKEEIENSKGSKEAWNFPSNFGKTQEENFCVSANFFLQNYNSALINELLHKRLKLQIFLMTLSEN